MILSPIPHTPPSRRGGLAMADSDRDLPESPPEGDWPRNGLSTILERAFGPFRRVEPPEPRQAAGFYTDTTVCIGCKACEVACKQWNQLPSDGFRWSGNSYDNT